jgi:hypothetical protein
MLKAEGIANDAIDSVPAAAAEGAAVVSPDASIVLFNETEQMMASSKGNKAPSNANLKSSWL